MDNHEIVLDKILLTIANSMLHGNDANFEFEPDFFTFCEVISE